MKKGIGFPTVGGKGADECCDAVKAGHPCMMLIDGNGIIRGRWDAWTPTSAEEARLAVWALHVVPRDGIKADSVIVAKYLGEGRNLEAAYLLTLMPDEVSTATLRFKALMAVRSGDAVEYFNRLQEHYERDLPKDPWILKSLNPQYAHAMEDISDLVYQSDDAETEILDCGIKAVRTLMSTRTRQTIHNRTKLGVLRYRYGQRIMESGRRTLSNMLVSERTNSNDKQKYAEVEEAARKYNIKIDEQRKEFVPNAATRRMLEVDAESKRHMAGLNDTANVKTDKDSKLTPQLIVPQKLRPGKESTIEVHITIADGWHAYADTEKTRSDGFFPTTVEFTLPKGFKPVGKQRIQPEQNDLLSGSFIVSQDFICPASTKIKAGSDHSAKVKITYQVCDNGHCLPPVDIEAQGSLRFKQN